MVNPAAIEVTPVMRLRFKDLQPEGRPAVDVPSIASPEIRGSRTRTAGSCPTAHARLSNPYTDSSIGTGKRNGSMPRAKRFRDSGEFDSRGPGRPPRLNRRHRSQFTECAGTRMRFIQLPHRLARGVRKGLWQKAHGGPYRARRWWRKAANEAPRSPVICR